MTVQKAIFIGIDGVQLEQLLLLGLQGKAQVLLGLDIVESYTGGVEGTASEQATSSGPGWSTLLTGVWVDQHGISSNNNQPINAEVDSIFEYVDAAITDATIASVVNWSPINTGHFADEMGFLSEPGIVDIEAHGLSDAEVTNMVVELIDAEAPDFTFVHLDEPDGAGHSSGFGDAYDQSLVAASEQVGQILAAVAQREAENPEEDWLVIVSTDHGRDPFSGSSHGSQSDSERRTFIAANEELATFDEPVPATSVLTTILDHLGIDYDLAADGLESGSLLEGAPDPLPPVIEALIEPADDAARVPLDASLTVRFSENVQAGSGSIFVKKADDGSVVATIDAASAQVAISGDTVTIDLQDDLAPDTEYYVEIDPGAFTDGVNGFAGISGSVTWNFTTEADLLPPEIVSLTPADDAEEIAADSDLVIQFNETVVAGAGNIVIKRAADGTVVETIDVTSDQVAIAGDTVTINPSADLAPGTEYFIEIEAGALRDTASRVTLFAEDFEGLPLDPFVSPTEGGGDGTDFTATPPEGWTQENTTPAGGPTEFYGWTFQDKNSWSATGGNQGRGDFTKGTGTVMVADPDEYDDADVDIDPNLFNAFMSTPAIDLGSVEAGSVTLTFDSSWRPEDNQKASLMVSYDGGEPVELLTWTSDPTDPNYKADATNETITIALNNPEGAGTAVVTFGVYDAGNDWWWAIDNLVIQGKDTTGTSSGNAFAGIGGSTWSFTTAEETGDVTAPILVSLTPGDGSADVTTDANLVAVFDEAIQKGVGNIVIHAADGSVVETIDVAGENVTVDGNTLTVDPATVLAAGGDYYVTIDAGAVTDTADTPVKTVLFEENFESLTSVLGPLVSGTETGGDGTDFTATLPEGWSQDNATPAGGPLEFYGWTFFDASSWVATAGDQGRGEFTKASGVVMVADPDEYDDGATDVDPDQFKAGIKTAAIDLAGVAAGSATLTFDSSWRAEDMQTARVFVSFDGGEPVELMLWSSDPADPNFKDDATNETVTLDLGNPEGAGTAVVTFELVGGNDWWWAVDNIVVEGDTGGTGTANAFAGLSDPTAWNFSTEAGDDGGFVGDDGDNVLGGTAGDDVIDGKGGADDIRGALGDDLVLGGDGDDDMRGGDGADEIDGGAGNDSIRGGGGEDELHGGAGDDALRGGDGDDELHGEDGNDSLRGGGGSDLLVGGAGSDALYGGGGGGVDSFLFAAGSGSDRVYDFDAGSDVIMLQGFDFADVGAVLAAATETHAGLVLTLDEENGDRVTLLGVSQSSLNEDNLLLVA